SIIMHCAYHQNENIREAAIPALEHLRRCHVDRNLGLEAVAVVGHHEMLAEKESKETNTARIQVQHPLQVTDIVKKAIEDESLKRELDGSKLGRDSLAY